MNKNKENFSNIKKQLPWEKLPKSQNRNQNTIRDLKYRNTQVKMVNRNLHILTNNFCQENPFIILQSLGFSWDNSWTKDGHIIFKHLSGERYIFSGTKIGEKERMIIKMRNIIQTNQKE